MTHLTYTSATLLVFAMISIAHAEVATPSFNCADAQRKDELAICSSKHLANLDQISAEGFSQIRQISPDIAHTVARRFLKMRGDCGSDTSCIESVQREAIQQYRILGADLSATPPQKQRPASTDELGTESYDQDRGEASITPALIAEGECVVVAASRRTMEEVQEFITTLDGYFDDIRVFQSENGWYAITVGTTDMAQGKGVVRSLVDSNLVPEDAFCSSGRLYVNEVNVDAALAENAIKKDANISVEENFERRNNIFIVGDDLSSGDKINLSEEECAEWCLSLSRCVAYTWVRKNGMCLPKHDTEYEASDNNAVSGVLFSDEKIAWLHADSSVEYVEMTSPFRCRFIGWRIECTVVSNSVQVTDANLNRGNCADPFATVAEIEREASQDAYFARRLEEYKRYGWTNLGSLSGILIFRMDQALQFADPLEFGEQFTITAVDKCNLIEVQICTTEYGCWTFENY